jgi:hypothetical protein
VAEQVWADQESELHRMPIHPGAAPLTEAEKKQIMDDFWLGKSLVMALLRVKTTHWRQLPWLLCGLAATCEAEAREVAQVILDAWEKVRDNPPGAHHRVTHALLANQEFLGQLRDFAGGLQRDRLTPNTLTQIARLRFIPTVETTVEEKHARVSQANRRHHISPVRVSMANRMPLLERLLARGHVNALRLLEVFTQARKLAKLPGLLCIESHDLLLEPCASSAPRRKALCSVIYQCDLKSLFWPSEAAKRHHQRAKYKHGREIAKVLGDRGRPGCQGQSGQLAYEPIVMRAMMAHLVKVHQPASTYSAPKSACEASSLLAALSQPQTLARAGPDPYPAAPDDDGDTGAGLDIDGASEPHIFFHIVLANPAAKKLVPVAIGSGGRIQTGSVVVTFHPVISGSSAAASETEPLVVSSRPLAVPGYPDPTFLLDGFKDCQGNCCIQDLPLPMPPAGTCTS